MTEHPSLRFAYTVYGFSSELRFKRDPVATFFHTSDAEEFAMHPERYGSERPTNGLYISAGKRDERKFGFRPNRDERFVWVINPDGSCSVAA